MKANTEKLVSILMPVYNVEKYIEEAVYSIINQSYKNWELIVVDDRSTDTTYEKIQKIAKNDNRIKLFRNSKNSKICKTLNYALSKANGDYVARMDGDDISLQNRLKELVNFLDIHKDIALVGSQVASIDEDGNKISKKKLPKNPEKCVRLLKFQSTVLHVWVAKKEVYEALNGYRDMPSVEDYDFLLRTVQKGYKIANCNECLYLVRIRDGNTNSTTGLAQRKAQSYAWKLSKKEQKNNIDLYSKNDFNNAVSSTRQEIESYNSSSKNLKKAILNKRNPIKMIFYALIASLQSIHTLRYLVSSIIVRISILNER